jgi:hypothetical protein
MKKFLVCILAFTMLFAFNACDEKQTTDDNRTVNNPVKNEITNMQTHEQTTHVEITIPEETECNHRFNKGYCTYCNELDPDCYELTAQNYEDFLNIRYRMANIDGSTGTYGFVAFPTLFLSVSPTSSRLSFYDVTIELKATVQQYLYNENKYENYTVNTKIPISILGKGEEHCGLERESYSPVVIDQTFISDFEIVSITGCVSVN